MDLNKLISQIQSIDGSLKQEASKAVNRLLTIRNWLIGYYIVEYEQKGEDKAKYGDNVLKIISNALSSKGLSETNLKLNRLFYIAYPTIAQNVLDELKNKIIGIRQTSDELGNNLMGIGQTVSGQFEDDLNVIRLTSDEYSNNLIGIGQTVSAQSYSELSEKMINSLSFSHITLLLPLESPLKRAFYAIKNR